VSIIFLQIGTEMAPAYFYKKYKKVGGLRKDAESTISGVLCRVVGLMTSCSCRRLKTDADADDDDDDDDDSIGRISHSFTHTFISFVLP